MCVTICKSYSNAITWTQVSQQYHSVVMEKVELQVIAGRSSIYLGNKEAFFNKNGFRHLNTWADKQFVQKNNNNLILFLFSCLLIALFQNFNEV